MIGGWSTEHMHAGRQNGFVVHFDENRILARGREGEVADFVNEIDALERGGRFEGALNQRLQLSRIGAEGDFYLVAAGGAIGQRHKPDHEWMRDGKPLGLDIGENAEDGVFAGGGIDVHAVAHQPSEKLRFGLHEAMGTRSARQGKSFCLERAGASGLNNDEGEHAAVFSVLERIPPVGGGGLRNRGGGRWTLVAREDVEMGAKLARGRGGARWGGDGGVVAPKLT